MAARSWPGTRGSNTFGTPAFYSYTAPEPAGLNQASLRPDQAFYSQELKEFILFYDDVRNADSPDETLMEFLQSTYDAGATLAKWDRAALERAVAVGSA